MPNASQASCPCNARLGRHLRVRTNPPGPHAEPGAIRKPLFERVKPVLLSSPAGQSCREEEAR